MDWVFVILTKKRAVALFLMVNTQGNRQCVDKTYFSGSTKLRGPEYTQGFNMMKSYEWRSHRFPQGTKKEQMLFFDGVP